MAESTELKLNNLQSALQEKYLYAEKLMLNTSNAKRLSILMNDIDSCFEALITTLDLTPEVMVSEMKGVTGKEETRREKSEFDARLNEWFIKLDAKKEHEAAFMDQAERRSTSSRSIRSRASSSRQIRLDALRKLKLAKLEMQQAAERQRETATLYEMKANQERNVLEMKANQERDALNFEREREINEAKRFG